MLNRRQNRLPRHAMESLESRCVLAADLVPAADEIRIPPAPNSLGALYPVVQVAADGTAFVVWFEYFNPTGAPDGYRSQIYGQAFDRQGRAMADRIAISSSDDPYATEFSLHQAPDGSYVVLWGMVPRSGYYARDAYFQRFSPHGVPLGERRHVNEPNGQELNVGATQLSLDFNGSGEFLVSWTGSVDSNYFGIRARWFTADGAPQAPVFAVFTTDNVNLMPNESGVLSIAGSRSVDVRFVTAHWLNNAQFNDVLNVRRATPPGLTEWLSPASTCINSDAHFQFDDGSCISDPSFGLELPQNSDPNISAKYMVKGYIDSRTQRPAFGFVQIAAIERKDGYIIPGSFAANSQGDVLAYWAQQGNWYVRKYNAQLEPLGDEFSLLPFSLDHWFDLDLATNDQLETWAVHTSPVNVPNTVSQVFVHRFTPPPGPGDIDGDGAVNFQDFVILRKSFGKTNQKRYQGDLTGDGRVDIQDFSQLFARRPLEAQGPPIAQDLAPVSFALLAEGPTSSLEPIAIPESELAVLRDVLHDQAIAGLAFTTHSLPAIVPQVQKKGQLSR